MWQCFSGVTRRTQLGHHQCSGYFALNLSKKYNKYNLSPIPRNFPDSNIKESKNIPAPFSQRNCSTSSLLALTAWCSIVAPLSSFSERTSLPSAATLIRRASLISLTASCVQEKTHHFLQHACDTAKLKLRAMQGRRSSKIF